MLNKWLVDEAARIMRDCGLNATIVERRGHLGIGVRRVLPVEDHPRFVFFPGTNCWEGTTDGAPAVLWTDVRSDEDNPTQLARGVFAALTRFAQNQI